MQGGGALSTETTNRSLFVLACEHDKCKSGLSSELSPPALLSYGGLAATAVKVTEAALSDSVVRLFL